MWLSGSGIGPWSGCNGVKLISEQRTAMFSPKWMSGRSSVKALLRAPLIPDPGWPEWFKLAGVANAKPSFVSTRYPNYELEAQAAMQGVGAALLSRFLFADLITQRSLIAPFPWTLEGRSDYWLLWTDEAAGSHFVKWIKSQFASSIRTTLNQRDV